MPLYKIYIYIYLQLINFTAEGNKYSPIIIKKLKKLKKFRGLNLQNFLKARYPGLQRKFIILTFRNSRLLKIYELFYTCFP